MGSGAVSSIFKKFSGSQGLEIMKFKDLHLFFILDFIILS